MTRTHRVRSRTAALLLLGAVAIAKPAVEARHSAAAQATATPSMPAGISEDDPISVVRFLSSPEFEGRRSGTAGNAKARSVLAARFRALGLTPLGDAGTFVASFHIKSKDDDGRGPLTDVNRGGNVVGLCRGTGAANGPAMVVSAHYDHLGVRSGVLYPGADDNASGVAGVLFLAKRCLAAPWLHDAVFALFDAEELGLQGSRAFVAAPPIPKSRLALNINLDMVSRNDNHELYVAGTAQRPQLKAVLDPIAARAPVKLLFGHDTPMPSAGPTYDWTMQSDHGAFQAQGIPFVYFGVEDHADYHKPSDTADKIEPAFLLHAVETVQQSIAALDRWLSSGQ